MNRSLVLLVLPLLLVAVPPGSASVEVTEVGKQPVEAGFPSGGLLNLDLCASEAEVRFSIESNRPDVFLPCFGMETVIH